MNGNENSNPIQPKLKNQSVSKTPKDIDVLRKMEVLKRSKKRFDQGSKEKHNTIQIKQININNYS